MMRTETQTKNEQIIEISEEKTYLKAEIKEIWTPHIIIAKNVSDMDIFHVGYIKIIESGKERLVDRYPWSYYVRKSSFSYGRYRYLSKELIFFIDMPYKKEHLVLISLNDLKDKKPGDVIIQKERWENNIFPYYSTDILYPGGLFGDFFYFYVKQLYRTIDTKEFPYFKICVTLRSAELSFKTIRNEFYDIGKEKGLDFITKINELLNKDKNEYIVKYFLTHFKGDDYLKKEFFEAKHILELYKVLESEPIRFANRGDSWIKPSKDPYKDIQKLKKKIENDLRDSLIYKAIRSYNFSIK